MILFKELFESWDTPRAMKKQSLNESLDTPRALHDHLNKEHMEHWANNMTEQQRIDADDYKGGGYSPTNNLLRHGSATYSSGMGILKPSLKSSDDAFHSGRTERANRIIGAMDAAVTAKTSRGMHIYRSLGEEHPELNIGDHFLDKGFVSGSIDHEKAFYVNPKGPMAKIYVPRGTFGTYIDNDNRRVGGKIHPHSRRSGLYYEKEFVLKRGTKFHVTRISTYNHPDGPERKMYHLRVVGQEDHPIEDKTK
jgi:hypothetical protein